ncbi:MAG: right-handed parallel beta-helix repeat-containing protein [Rhodospirillales bacterium]|nr:right-handed parallel beta-helix repeat-containing protein [Rhodospirillales bacterium]
MTAQISKEQKDQSVRVTSKRLKKLLSTSALVAAGMMTMGPAAQAQDHAWVLDQVAGSFDTDISIPDVTNITQNTSRAIGRGDLDIGAHQTVNIHQQNSGSIFAAIDNEADPAYLLGQLNANGTVIVIDNNGVFFGKDATINVGSIITSTGDMMNPGAFMAGSDPVFSNFGEGSIINEGTINVAEAGLAAFVSPLVSNRGVINARLGKVAFAAGETVTVDLYGDGLMEVAVDGELADALLQNSGEINAEGGVVTMTVSAAKDIVDNVINMEGVVDVSSVEVKGGKIILSGGNKGTVSVAGKMDASGTEGGEISVNGQNVDIADTAEINADGTLGDIRLIGQDSISFHGAASAMGGFIEVSGNHVIVDGTFKVGQDGEVLVDPVDLCVFGVGGACGSMSAVDFIASIRPVLIGGGTFTTTNAAGAGDGDVIIVGDLSSGGFDTVSRGTWNVIANDDVIIGDDGSNATGFGTQTANLVVGGAGLNLNLTSLAGAGAISPYYVWFENGSTVNTGGGDVSIRANDFYIGAGASLDAGAGTVSFARSTRGTIGLGAGAGDMMISQAAIDRIVAGALVVGDANAATSKTTEINVADIDTTGSIAGLVQLNALNNASVDEHNNNTYGADVEFDAGTNVFHSLEANAADDVVFRTNVSVTTTGGDMKFVADADANVGLGDTNQIEFVDGVGGATIDSAGNILFAGSDYADNFATTMIDANNGTGTVTFTRTSEGDVSVGDNNGGFHISQAELDNITAGTLAVGLAGGGTDNNLFVSNVDATAFGTTIFNTEIPAGPYDLTFMGTNSFGTLSANAEDDIIFAAGASVETNGNATFNADSDNGGAGDFIMNAGSSIDSNGNNILVHTGEFSGQNATYGVFLDTGADIDAEGGNIKFNNNDVFYSADADSVNTTGTGTIEINQYNGGSLQNAIDAISNTGSGQNTIYALGGTYNENLTINQHQLKLDGYFGATLNGTISVDEYNFNLDPFVVDAGGADYAVTATGVGANGLVIDGNTFKNSAKAAIYLEGNAASTGNIMGNTFEGSATTGVLTGTVNNGYTLNITDNTFGTDVDKMLVDGAHFGNVYNATVNFTGNSVFAMDDGVEFTNIWNDATLINISNNPDIHGTNGNGIALNGKLFSPYTTMHATINIDGNGFISGLWGILAGRTGGSADINVTNNDLIQGRQDGFAIYDLLSDTAFLNIDNNQFGEELDPVGDGIEDNDNGIDIHSVNSTRGVSITNNTIYALDDGIEFDRSLENTIVYIANNPEIVAGANGISFSGPDFNPSIINSNITIVGNNHGIHADDHGIFFGGTISNGSVLNIHDNIISANENNDAVGAGIFFDGTISNSTVNIGDGTSHFQSGASNIIRVAGNAGPGGTSGLDGIHFDAEIGDGSDISIDGNRLGYFAWNVGGTVYENFGGDHRLADDGIEFAGPITGNADISITDNFIRAKDDGIQFSNTIGDFAKILIGGWNDENKISAWDNGIAFLGNIMGQSTVEISYNDVDAGNDGVLFDAETSNGDAVPPYSEQEILIKKNKIVGGANGINFTEKASGFRHDITITQNKLIKGENGHGIVHSGNIDDAELWITDNDKIYGHLDGIHLEGYFYNNAKILIDGNKDIDSGVGDGIDVHDYIAGGVDVDITNNHVHHTGDNGIEVSNVDGVYIAGNTVHDTGANGIYVDPSDYVDITGNTVYDTEDDGIKLDDGHHGQIWSNTVYNTGDDGIDVKNNDHVEIWSNNIDNTEGTGIEVSDSYRALIKFNDIDETDGDGINVQNSDKARISNNEINKHDYSANTHGDGIEVGNSREVEIDYNTVDDAFDNGIYVWNSDKADIHHNTIEDVKENGIYLSNSDYSDIEHNTIDRVGQHGIKVNPSDYVDVAYNTIHNVGWDGINVDSGHHADIWGNHIGNVGRDGIDVDGNYRVEIWDNYIHNTGDNGIEVSDSDHAEIKKNDITGAGKDGINVENSDHVLIGWNDIFASLGHHYGVMGAERDGIHVENGSDLLVIGNDITAALGHHGSNGKLGAGRHGIYVEGGKDIAIKYNDVLGDSHGYGYFKKTIGSVGEDGIHVTGAEDILIKGNEISRAGDDGIQVVIGGHDDHNDDVKFRGLSIQTLGNYDDTNRIIIVDNNVEHSGDDGIVVNTAEEKHYKDEKFGGPSIQLFGGPIQNNNQDNSQKLYIKIADNNVTKSGDDGIEVNLKTSGTSGESMPPVFALKGFGGGFGGGFDQPDNHIEILNNHVSFSGDNGILVKIAPKDGEHQGDGFGGGPQQFLSLNSFDNEGGSEGGLYNLIKIDGNYVSFSGDDGIQVDVKSKNAGGNEGYPYPETKTLGFGFEGPGFGNDNGAKNTIIISDNHVAFSGDDGVDVDVESKGGNTANTIKILGNKIAFSGDDGIDVDVKTKGGQQQQQIPNDFNVRTLGFEGPGFGGGNNQTTNTIFIAGNKVAFSGDDGIDVNVENKGGQGGKGGYGGPVVFNTLDFGGGSNGGSVNNFITIMGNDVVFSRDDGIVVKVDNPESQGKFGGPVLSLYGPQPYGGFGGNHNFISIIGNDVKKSGDDGIQVEADKKTAVDLMVGFNHVQDSSDNGILLIANEGGHFGRYGRGGPEEKVSLALVSEEYNYGCGDDCGEYEGIFNSYIFGNTVENSGSNGLYVKGYGHENVVLKGNTFIDNPTGARFESGKIDLSDLERPNSFIVNPDYVLPEGYDYVTGMQFDLAKSYKPDSLTIVGETLGATLFSGFITRPVGTAYYVRFEDGAILDCFGQPIVIDGMQVSWDGFVPADNLDGDGHIPAGVLAAIENRLWDADDPLKNGRGQIFVGTPANVIPDIEEEDILKSFDPFNIAANQVSVALVGGLPIIPGNEAAFLAGIAPAAGGEGEPTAEELAGIAPAAGEGVNETCWGDAIANAGAGGVVNYNFGTGMDEILNDASACQSTF